MKIGIVGLGLIGGSIYKCLLSKGIEVIAVSNSQSGYGIFKTYEELRVCDLVFVCSAMNRTLEILDELDKILSEDTVVTDVCSIKSFVCQKKRRYHFIPSHPMAGTEKQGFENSFGEMFEGAKWVITPYDGGEGVSKLVEVIQQLGASPVITTPEKHDEAVAMISHMPMLVAQAIFKAASDNPLALEIAASGFRDMTRLAMSNTEMAKDMITMNSDNIQNAVLKMYTAIGNLTTSEYFSQIEKIKKERSKMFTEK